MKRRWSRQLMWLTAVSCGLLVSLFTGCPGGVWYTFSGGTELGVELADGAARIMLDAYVPTTPAASRPALSPGWHSGRFADRWPESYVFYWPVDFDARSVRMDQQHEVEIPILPFLGMAIALSSYFLYLWWRDRPAPPGHCPQCRYDLTGNTSGVCPECGRRVLPTDRHPWKPPSLDDRLTS